MIGYYLIGINIIAFVIYGIDKRKAIKQKSRIRESTLLSLAFVGGSIGALLGMFLFRHKTKKAKFTVSVPLMLVIQLVILLKLSRLGYII